jgi:hypothetical protein
MNPVSFREFFDQRFPEGSAGRGSQNIRQAEVEKLFAGALFDLDKFLPSQAASQNSSYTPRYPVFVPAGLDSRMEMVQDQCTVETHSLRVIAGFLNLGKSQGWTEGGDPRVGSSFIRLILNKYKDTSRDESGIIEKTLRAFKNTSLDSDDSHLPKNSRTNYDEGVSRWRGHAVGRLVGNLASNYAPSKPFFEVLVNSQVVSGSSTCHPFHVSVHANQTVLEQRRDNLRAYEDLPDEIARPVFYSKTLVAPDKFLKDNLDKMGKNGTRILEALNFLQNKEMQGQTVGNCWLKQPLRCLLASLFIDLSDEKKDLSFERVWGETILLYKDIQKKAGIPLIENLLKTEKIDPSMRQSALRELERRKSL